MHRARQIILWMVMLALPLYGCTGTLLQILGPVHSHAPVHTAPADFRFADPISQGVVWLAERWKDWQAYAHAQTHGAQGKARLPAPGHAQAHEHALEQEQEQEQEHHHDAFERHHHAPDGDLITLGAQAHGSADAGDLNAGAGAAIAVLALGLAASLRLPAPLAAAPGWLRAGTPMWRNAARRRLERPPRLSCCL